METARARHASRLATTGATGGFCFGKLYYINETIDARPLAGSPLQPNIAVHVLANQTPSSTLGI